MAVTVGVASRQGTRAHNADAAAVHHFGGLRTAAAVVDGIGSSPAVASCSPLLAQVAARIGARRGGLAGLLSAGDLLSDPEAETAEPEPDAVAVLAVAAPGQPTVVHWVGDCRAYGWNGQDQELRLYTTDHTVGQHLRINGAPWVLAAEHDNWVRTTLSRAVVATIYEIEIPPEELVLLTSDGVHDQVGHDTLVALLHQHQGDDLHGLAAALVTAATEDDEGYRDDATAIVLRTCDGPSATPAPTP